MKGAENPLGPMFTAMLLGAENDIREFRKAVIDLCHRLRPDLGAPFEAVMTSGTAKTLQQFVENKLPKLFSDEQTRWYGFEDIHGPHTVIDDAKNIIPPGFIRIRPVKTPGMEEVTGISVILNDSAKGPGRRIDLGCTDDAGKNHVPVMYYKHQEPYVIRAADYRLN
jgi:hypothetical protein